MLLTKKPITILYVICTLVVISLNSCESEDPDPSSITPPEDLTLIAHGTLDANGDTAFYRVLTYNENGLLSDGDFIRYDEEDKVVSAINQAIWRPYKFNRFYYGDDNLLDSIVADTLINHIWYAKHSFEYDNNSVLSGINTILNGGSWKSYAFSAQITRDEEKISLDWINSDSIRGSAEYYYGAGPGPFPEEWRWAYSFSSITDYRVAYARFLIDRTIDRIVYTNELGEIEDEINFQYEYNKYGFPISSTSDTQDGSSFYIYNYD